MDQIDYDKSEWKDEEWDQSLVISYQNNIKYGSLVDK
jgi:hypothetical protein